MTPPQVALLAWFGNESTTAISALCSAQMETMLRRKSYSRQSLTPERRDGRVAVARGERQHCGGPASCWCPPLAASTALARAKGRQGFLLRARLFSSCVRVGSNRSRLRWAGADALRAELARRLC